MSANHLGMSWQQHYVIFSLETGRKILYHKNKSSYNFGGKHMNCPYCGKEMDEGLIQSPQEISWIAGTKKKLLGRAKFHADSVVLSELSMLKGSAAAACLCRDCKKIVIDYADGKSDYNRR